jgi:hypothetical protein
MQRNCDKIRVRQKGEKGEHMGYIKTINLSGLSKSDIAILKDSVAKMGFSEKDYRIVEFGSDGVEMKITSPFLHRILKIIRKTEYTKGGKI